MTDHATDTLGYAMRQPTIHIPKPGDRVRIEEILSCDRGKPEFEALVGKVFLVREVIPPEGKFPLMIGVDGFGEMIYCRVSPLPASELEVAGNVSQPAAPSGFPTCPGLVESGGRKCGAEIMTTRNIATDLCGDCLASLDSANQEPIDPKRRRAIDLLHHDLDRPLPAHPWTNEKDWYWQP